MDFRNILVPVDFSSESRAIVPGVKAMARLFDSTVFLLRVDAEPDPHLSDKPPSPSAHSLAEMANAGFNGFTVIVVKVLSDAPCSVWTSTHVRSDQTVPERRIPNILCAIDLGPESRALIRAADSLGARTGAKVRLVPAVPGEETEPLRALNVESDRYPNEDGSRPYPRDKTSPPRCHRSKYCARIAAARLQQETGTAFDLCLQAGRASRVIRAVGIHHQADLVIAGRGHKHGRAGYLRTEVYSIVRDSLFPVLRF